MSVTMNGRTYDATDFTGSNGYGYAQNHPDTGNPLFPNQIFTDMLAELAAADTVQTVAPGAAGGILVSDGSAWVRAASATITSAGAATLTSLTVSGASRFNGVLRGNTDVDGSATAGGARFTGVSQFDAAVQFGTTSISSGASVEVNRSTGTASITPAVLRVRATGNASDWVFGSANPWGVLDFYSDDASGGGVGVRARLATYMLGATGSTYGIALQVRTAAGTLTDAIIAEEIGAGAASVRIPATSIGFYTATAVAQQTGVAVTAAGVHAALVNLGLITA